MRSKVFVAKIIRATKHIVLQSFCAMLLMASPAWAEKADVVMKVWPGKPPGPEMKVGEEQDFTKDADDLIAGRRIIKLGNVTSPEAHVYLPPKNKHTGAAVVICPGGGFSILAWDLEGTEVAQWLNTLGIAGIVLKYRVPTRDQDPRWKAPVQDTQRTMSLVRHNAKEWGIDTEQVAVLGFSAGGMTAFNTSIAAKRHYEEVDDADKQPFKPNRSILIYAAGLPGDGSGWSGGDVDTAGIPPVFMVHAFDDFVPVEGTANLLLQMKKNKIPCELHVYESGGHGYGLRKRADRPVTHWTAPCEAWLRKAKWID